MQHHCNNLPLRVKMVLRDKTDLQHKKNLCMYMYCTASAPCLAETEAVYIRN